MCSVSSMHSLPYRPALAWVPAGGHASWRWSSHNNPVSWLGRVGLRHRHHLPALTLKLSKLKALAILTKSPPCSLTYPRSGGRRVNHSALSSRWRASQPDRPPRADACPLLPFPGSSLMCARLQLRNSFEGRRDVALQGRVVAGRHVRNASRTYRENEPCTRPAVTAVGHQHSAHPGCGRFSGPGMISCFTGTAAAALTVSA
ncbi:hypothetical protein C8Q74DRAFT_528552 [Fomes fomentarius]|nr:hypothetical protein C8Q74DRAFT_528552 [Fomes fomentarius]